MEKTIPEKRSQAAQVVRGLSYHQLCSTVIPGEKENYWLVELHFKGRTITLETFWEAGQPKTIDIAYQIALQINQLREWLDQGAVESVSSQHHELFKMEKKMAYLFKNPDYLQLFIQNDERFFASIIEPRKLS